MVYKQEPNRGLITKILVHLSATELTSNMENNNRNIDFILSFGYAAHERGVLYVQYLYAYSYIYFFWIGSSTDNAAFEVIS